MVAQAELPEALHEVAFGKVFDYLVTQSESHSESPKAVLHQNAEQANALSEIAATSGLNTDVVGSVYLVRDDQLRVVVPTKYLNESKLPGTQEVAILLAAGRNWAGISEWTNAREIRDNCQNLGTLDSGNFAAALKKIDVFSVDSSGSDRAYRINQVGLERAKSMLESWFQAE